MIGYLNRAYHRHILGHFIVYHPALVPDDVIRDGAGKPLINVFVQDTFQDPDARHECNCGKEWRR